MESAEQKTIFEEVRGTLDEIIHQVKKLIREGNARRVVIKNKKGKILFQSQLTLGVAGTAFMAMVAPIISAITICVMYFSDVKVFIEREVDEASDEYEVEAEVIEIDDEEDEKEDLDKTDKTVGKKKK
jgi:hypothetical protein